MISSAIPHRRVAIMQPYFLPYIGYFQLIASADLFVVYDNIQYTKRGWINRNRILKDGEATTISVPLKGDSSYLDIVDRHLAPDFRRDKLLNQIRSAYRGAPYFDPTMRLVEEVVLADADDLFGFLHTSIALTCRHLGIATEIAVSSEIPIDHDLRGEDRVLALCAAVDADSYVNAIGGRELYSRETFASAGIDLAFISSGPLQYPQFGAPFVPWLSIIDVMMFNPAEAIMATINTGYELV